MQKRVESQTSLIELLRRGRNILKVPFVTTNRNCKLYVAMLVCELNLKANFLNRCVEYDHRISFLRAAAYGRFIRKN